MVGAHSGRPPEEDASSPGGPPSSTGAPGSGPTPAGRPIPWRASRWRSALAVIGLSVLLPGTGHLYVRHVRRAIACSLVFLLGVLPAAVFAFLVASSFTWKSVYWIAVVVVTFGLACALGPLLVVLRARRGAAERPKPPPSRWVLGSYVAAGVLLAVLEAVLFLGPSLRTARVDSSALEPILSRGDTVTVLVSPYVHPVHGDVVLFRIRLGSEESAASPADSSGHRSFTRLGRVLAEGNDRVEAQDGRLLVNEVPLDLSRTDQAWLLAKAGRAERRRRALRSLLKPVEMLFPWLGEKVVQDVVRWDAQTLEPSVVPEGSLLILPDWEQDSVAPPQPSEAPAEPAALEDDGGDRDHRPLVGRPRWAILVPRAAIEGRMIF